MNKKIIALAIAAMVGGALNAEAAIEFDRTGAGGSAAILSDGDGATIFTDVFDWAPGNILFQNIVRRGAAEGQAFAFDLYGHGVLSSYLLNGNPVALSAPGSEITYTFKVPVIATVGPAATSWNLNALGGGTFEMFFQSAANSVAATGAGFSDGQLILSGAFQPRFDPLVYANGESGNLSSSAIPGTKPLLDQNSNGTTSLGSIRTDKMNGSVNLAIDALFADRNFFITDVTDQTDPLEFDVDFASFLGAPFTQVDPSAIVGGKSGETATIGANAWGTAPGATTGPFNITPNFGGDNLNNAGCTTFPCDIMVQSDASSKFTATLTPEPGTLALIGASMLGLGISRRRSRKAA